MDMKMKNEMETVILMGYIWGIWFYWGYIGIMENKMEITT